MCRLEQCAEEQRHVPESLYPFTYNPKMSLNLSQVPNSSQRSPPFTRTQVKNITDAKDEMVGLNDYLNSPRIGSAGIRVFFSLMETHVFDVVIVFLCAALSFSADALTQRKPQRYAA